jgi:CheY-like chemotaxis protein
MGYAEILMEDLTGQERPRRLLQEIVRSSERAATLTRQLLAFSRRQVLSPQVIDLNETVQGVENLIQRLIGDDIELRTRLETPLRLVRVDPGQLEQVLVNLAVNARDAMPSGGVLTVTTKNGEIDAAMAKSHPELRPGPAVMIEVADTGHGMDAETLSHAFEPFFTTKARGKGTGLGLSMVFGIVKQSGGDISVESQPGQGTMFRICFPAAQEQKTQRPSPRETAAAPRGSETILLVEDDARVRDLAREILRGGGYEVLSASDAATAAHVAAEHRGPLHLLVTDVVMPGESGPQLAERLSSWRPGLKILYISGYAGEIVSRHLDLRPGIAFLPKPFTREILLRKVRETLDAPTLVRHSGK